MSDDMTTLEEWIKKRYGILYNSAEIESTVEGEWTVPLPEGAPHDKAQIRRAIQLLTLKESLRVRCWITWPHRFPMSGAARTYRRR